MTARRIPKASQWGSWSSQVRRVSELKYGPFQRRKAAPTFGFTSNAPSIRLDCRPFFAYFGSLGPIMHNLLLQMQSSHPGEPAVLTA